MAEDKTIETTNESKEAEKKPSTEKPSVVWYTPEHKLFVIVGLVIIFVLLLGVAFAAGHHAWRRDNEFGGRVFSNMQYSPRHMQAFGYGLRGGMMGTDGTTTSNTRVSGVVTAVDGDSITVAGDGTTTKVTVSSNTTYSGSSEPAKVNDTITAVGAKDGSGTLIASSVYLSRQ